LVRPHPTTPTLSPYTTLFRSVLRLASLDAPDRNLVAPARAVVRRDRQRDVGRGAVRLAWSRLSIAGGEDIDVGIVRIGRHRRLPDRKSTRLNSSHQINSYAVV